MIGLDSLRRRLVASMLLVFALGLGGALALRPFEGRGAILSRLDVDLIQEPYQDVLVLVAFTVLATGLILLVSQWSLRNLEEASREAARVGPRDPTARITAARLPQEIRPMVAAVNAALDRMAEAFDAERRLVADAAHELRTPLAVLSLRLQQARHERPPDWATLDCDVAQLSRIVSQLLDLARKESARHADAPLPAIIDMARTAREACAMILPLADAAGRRIEVDFPERLSVRGRADDLRDMLRNLLENALEHGQGRIRVSGHLTKSKPDEQQVVVSVTDQGTTLSAGERMLLFDRFRKVDPSSPGSGLGLAIVREVVRAHRGTVMFMPGSETEVRIRLPFQKVAPASSG